MATAALQEALASVPAPAKKVGGTRAAKRDKAKAKAKASQGKSSKGNPSKNKQPKGKGQSPEKKQRKEDREERTPARKMGSDPEKETPAKTGKAELKQDLKNVHSRAYHRALLLHKNAGMEHEPAKAMARQAAAQAVQAATAAESSDLD